MVEYRRIKTKEGLTKEPIAKAPKKIPETFATVRIQDDEDLTVTSVPQKALTSDCWLVQFNGFRSCADCEVYLKPDCGGGATLTKMIIDHFQDSIYTKMQYNEYWGTHETGDGKSFFTWVEETRNTPAFQYTFKKYKRHIKDLQIMSEDPDGPDLDGLYPFLEEFDAPNNKTTDQSGYHQHHQCDCVRTTKKGSYRDVTIEQTDKTGALIRTLYYYHQHCVVVNEKGTIWLNSAGYRTSTTKERINRYLPSGWYLYSDKRIWYLVKRRWTQDGREDEIGPIRFYDGMKMEDI